MLYTRRIIVRCGAVALADLSKQDVESAIAEVKDKMNKRLGLVTRGRHARAMKTFSRWLMVEARTQFDLLIGLSMKGYNPDLDRRRERRTLTDEEWVKLINAAERGPEVCGMSGPDRVLLYNFVMQTGFRRGTIASLVPESFLFGEGGATVTAVARHVKQRKRQDRPLRQDLAAMLQVWLISKPKGVPVFNLPEKTAKMLRADLLAAGIHYEIDGRIFDFHALRACLRSSVIPDIADEPSG